MNIKIINNTKYRHYKTKQLYEIIGTALHSETHEDMIVYRALYECEKYGLHQIWVRPAKMFFEKIQVGDTQLPRFELVSLENS